MSASLQRNYKLRPSRYLTFVISFFCLLTFGVLLFLPLGMMLFTVIGLCIWSVCAYALFRDARLSFAHSCVAFHLESNETLSLILRDGRHLKATLVAGGVILPFIVLINLRLEQGGHRSLVLLRDSTDAASYRRLRVVLRWGAKQQDPISSV